MKLLPCNWFYLPNMAVSYGFPPTLSSAIAQSFSMCSTPFSPTDGENTLFLHVVMLQSDRDQRKHLRTEFFLAVSTGLVSMGCLRLNDLFAIYKPSVNNDTWCTCSPCADQIEGPKEGKWARTYFSIVLTHTWWHKAKGKRKNTKRIWSWKWFKCASTQYCWKIARVHSDWAFPSESASLSPDVAWNTDLI